MERSGIDIRVQGMVGNLFDPITVVLRIPAEMSNCRDKDFLLLTHVLEGRRESLSAYIV
jgi:hypothetical protein